MISLLLPDIPMLRSPYIRYLMLAAAVMMGMGPDGREAAAQEVINVTAASKVYIDGKTNVNTFTCVSDDVDGHGRLGGEDSATGPSGRVEIPVRTFDCRNERMNRDLFEALKGEKHPFISYSLDGVRVLDDTYDNGAVLLEANGTVRVAGVARSIRARVVGDRLANGQLRATGTLVLSMSEFDIDPPTAVLGLVRVRDTINVRFELVAKPDARLTGGKSTSSIFTSVLPGGGSNDDG